MEQRGRNQPQPVANGKVGKRLEQAKTIAARCVQLAVGAHGWEEVDGSISYRRASWIRVKTNRSQVFATR